MPSFDVVSEVNAHELTNAVDQTNREISRRFDLKEGSANVSLEDKEIIVIGDDDFQVEQVEKILQTRLVARQIDLSSLKEDKTDKSVSQVKKHFKIQEGIDTPNGKKINQLIKGNKFKAQSSIMDNKVRVTAKKIDDLQAIMKLLKEETFDMPLQFNNFRD